ncbi:MAG TPA: hypothetical protein VE596_19175 [Gaiellaceae bacterium]|jgi:hypothetical protein|nr:hypothetical protein [Gaiellaceae bacterium]
MEAAAADRVEGLAASFASASDAAGGVTADDYVVGGSRVSLRFASGALRERLTPAFAHLAAPPGTPELTVHLWDSVSTGAEPPPRPRVRRDEPAGALYHFQDPPLRGAYQPGLETFSVLDSQAGVAWYWVVDALAQPSGDQACPIRQILFWWLGSRGYLQVHGAAVGTPGGGVLVVGQAGSGKSTVALACLGSELLYAGDDYVAVALEPSPRIASLYNSGKLDPAHVHGLLPHLLPLLANADRVDEEKAIIYVEQHFPEQTTAGFPLAAVLVPTVRAERREPEIVPASRATAFAALGPSTMFQLHTAGAGELATLSSLVARVPCYTLELGSDLSAIPGKISELL